MFISVIRNQLEISNRHLCKELGCVFLFINLYEIFLLKVPIWTTYLFQFRQERA